MKHEPWYILVTGSSGTSMEDLDLFGNSKRVLIKKLGKSSTVFEMYFSVWKWGFWNISCWRDVQSGLGW